jgi:hypothetical protein
MERDAARKGVMWWPPDKLLIRGSRCGTRLPQWRTESWINFVVYVIAAMEERLVSWNGYGASGNTFQEFHARRRMHILQVCHPLSLYAAVFATVGPGLTKSWPWSSGKKLKVKEQRRQTRVIRMCIIRCDKSTIQKSVSFVYLINRLEPGVVLTSVMWRIIIARRRFHYGWPGWTWSDKILAVKKWEEFKSERDKSGDNGTRNGYYCTCGESSQPYNRVFHSYIPSSVLNPVLCWTRVMWRIIWPK